MKKYRRGFTLLELMVTIFIVLTVLIILFVMVCLLVLLARQAFA